MEFGCHLFTFFLKHFCIYSRFKIGKTSFSIYVQIHDFHESGKVGGTVSYNMVFGKIRHIIAFPFAGQFHQMNRTVIHYDNIYSEVSIFRYRDKRALRFQFAKPNGIRG